MYWEIELIFLAVVSVCVFSCSTMFNQLYIEWWAITFITNPRLLTVIKYKKKRNENNVKLQLKAI